MHKKRFNTSSSVLLVTRKFLKNTEKRLLNRSIIKKYSKHWKQKNKIKKT